MTQPFMKVGLTFVAFFCLFYFEPIYVGPISIAVLWKSVLMLVLFGALMFRHGGARLNRLTAWGLLFVMSGFLNESLYINPIETISFAIKNAYIPIIFGFWLQRVRVSAHLADRSRELLLRLSVFIVLSTIPFLLNLISPISSGYDLSIFDDAASGAFGFVGVFQNAHGASVTLTAASVTLLWGLPYVRKRTTRLFYLAMVAVGSISVVLTLVRTGMAMFAAMILVLLATSRKRIHFRLATIFAAILLWSGFYLFETSETFRMRLLGENIYTVHKVETLNQISSGRILYWTSALEGFFSAPPLEQVFGFGPTLAKDHMFDTVGLRIYAHNGFIDILQFYGYFGVFAYSMMMLQVFKVLFSLKWSNPYFALTAIQITAYLVEMFVQGERYFLADVLFALALVGSTVAEKLSANPRPTIDGRVTEAAKEDRRPFSF